MYAEYTQQHYTVEYGLGNPSGYTHNKFYFSELSLIRSQYLKQRDFRDKHFFLPFD